MCEKFSLDHLLALNLGPHFHPSDGNKKFFNLWVEEFLAWPKFNDSGDPDLEVQAYGLNFEGSARASQPTGCEALAEPFLFQDVILK